MKILFFTNEYSHPKLPASGGVGSFLKVMSEELTERGHEIHVFGFSRKPIEFKDKDITFKFFKKYSKQFRFKEFVRSISTKLNIKGAELSFLKQERQYLAKQLKAYSQTHQIDVIESHVFNGITAYWDNSTPLVVRFHGSRGFWHYYLGAEKDEHKIEMEQKALEGTPNVVAVSKFSAKAVESIYSVSIDKIIYNGIDTSLFTTNASKKTIEKSIFYFGTLSKAKGVDTLCLVFNDVVQKYPGATLHIIGRGQAYWDYVSASILSENANKQTTYYGAKQLNELASILQNASLFIIPSLNENFGLIIAEAMALEKPIIASNTPSFNEIIDHNEDGFIAKNSEDYLKYISLLWENPQEAQRISKNAKQKVLSNFTKEKMVEDSLLYYSEILNKSKS